MSTPTDLPEDIEALKALVIAQRSELSAQHVELIAQQVELVAQRAEIYSHAAEIERLKLLVAKLKRLQFGRRSEKLDREIEQLELRLEELQLCSVPVPSAKPTAEEKTQPVHEPACNCPDCGTAMPQDRRGRLRSTRLRAGALQGDPPRAPEARLCLLSAHRLLAGL